MQLQQEMIQISILHRENLTRGLRKNVIGEKSEMLTGYLDSPFETTIRIHKKEGTIEKKEQYAVVKGFIKIAKKPMFS